jgi:diadenosine hexaphosphate hydrolase (ATP-forming)
MRGMIDETWYVHPPGVKERTCAGGVIVRQRRGGPIEVALAREGDFTHYVLPKGGVEQGEAIEAAARREIAEEAGLSGLVLLGELGARSRLNFARTRWVTVHYFAYLARGEAGQPTDSKRHYRAASWFPIEDLPALLWPEQRELIESGRGKIEAWLATDEHG